MIPYEIPFTKEPQTFTIPLGAVSYRLTTSWCSPAACWTLDIALADGTPLVSSIPIVPGVDLLKQYAYLGIVGKLFVQSSGDATRVPGFADLGTTGFVFFVSET